ncbi:unnamed protein product [Sphagnum balticum]
MEVRGILSDAQGQLADVFENSVERNQHSSASNWLRYGDTCSKAFFDFHRIGTKRTPLRELVTEEGLVTGQATLPSISQTSMPIFIPRTHGPPARQRRSRPARRASRPKSLKL